MTDPDVPVSACPSCGGELFVLSDGFDACRTCGVHQDLGRTLTEILDDVERFLRRYVVFANEHQAAATTLHVAHSHAIEAADTTGYLHVRSAEKRSGKTRLLECLEMLVRMPIRSTTISPAALFRLLDSERRTLLLDEVDSIFSPKADREELRGLLNAGYRRGSLAYRIEIRGKEMVPRAFDAFGAKILAGIGNLPDTIADRSIPIELRRRRPDEPVERFRFRDAHSEAEAIRRRLENWVRTSGTVAQLRSARPDMPHLDDDRALEAWEPLVAIADVRAHHGQPAREMLLRPSTASGRLVRGRVSPRCAPYESCSERATGSAQTSCSTALQPAMTGRGRSGGLTSSNAPTVTAGPPSRRCGRFGVSWNGSGSSFRRPERSGSMMARRRKATTGRRSRTSGRGTYRLEPPHPPQAQRRR